MTKTPVTSCDRTNTIINPFTTPDIVIGLDVGKTGHHACALTTTGERIYDKPLVQDKAALRDIFAAMQAHGSVLMVVDKPNTIGALPIAAARDCGCTVGYLPGLAMRKAADLYPGRSKTDRRDAFIIADTARTMPHTLRAVDRDDETLAALKMLAGFDDDIAKDPPNEKPPSQRAHADSPRTRARLRRRDSLAHAGAGLAHPLRRSDKTGRRRSRPGPEVDAQPRQEGPCCPG